MELTIKNLSKLWEQWIGSRDMVVGKPEKPPVNFLGSQKKYKERFLKVATEFIKNDKSVDKLKEQLQEANDALQFCAGTSYGTDANEMAEEYLNKWKAWS